MIAALRRVVGVPRHRRLGDRTGAIRGAHGTAPGDGRLRGRAQFRWSRRMRRAGARHERVVPAAHRAAHCGRSRRRGRGRRLPRAFGTGSRVLARADHRSRRTHHLRERGRAGIDEPAFSPAPRCSVAQLDELLAAADANEGAASGEPSAMRLRYGQFIDRRGGRSTITNETGEIARAASPNGSTAPTKFARSVKSRPWCTPRASAISRSAFPPRASPATGASWRAR